MQSNVIKDNIISSYWQLLTSSLNVGKYEESRIVIIYLNWLRLLRQQNNIACIHLSNLWTQNAIHSVNGQRLYWKGDTVSQSTWYDEQFTWNWRGMECRMMEVKNAHSNFQKHAWSTLWAEHLIKIESVLRYAPSDERTLSSRQALIGIKFNFFGSAIEFIEIITEQEIIVPSPLWRNNWKCSSLGWVAVAVVHTQAFVCESMDDPFQGI